jgi:hypothetical protein
MPIIKLDLDLPTYEKLAEAAVRELRPVHWHAWVLLQRALGMPFPKPNESSIAAPEASEADATA